MNEPAQAKPVAVMNSIVVELLFKAENSVAYTQLVKKKLDMNNSPFEIANPLGEGFAPVKVRSD